MKEKYPLFTFLQGRSADYDLSAGLSTEKREWPFIRESRRTVTTAGDFVLLWHSSLTVHEMFIHNDSNCWNSLHYVWQCKLWIILFGKLFDIMCCSTESKFITFFLHVELIRNFCILHHYLYFCSQYVYIKGSDILSWVSFVKLTNVKKNPTLEGHKKYLQ